MVETKPGTTPKKRRGCVGRKWTNEWRRESWVLSHTSNVRRERRRGEELSVRRGACAEIILIHDSFSLETISIRVKEEGWTFKRLGQRKMRDVPTLGDNEWAEKFEEFKDFKACSKLKFEVSKSRVASGEVGVEGVILLQRQMAEVDDFKLRGVQGMTLNGQTVPVE